MHGGTTMSRHRSRTARTALAAAVAAAGALTLTAAPAAPAEAGACPSGYHCVYKDGIGDNQEKNFFNDDANFTNNAFADSGGTVNDNVSAARNRSSGNFRSRYWYDINYAKIVFCVNPGHNVSSLSDDGIPGNSSWQNDEASSLDLASGSLSGCF